MKQNYKGPLILLAIVLSLVAALSLTSYIMPISVPSESSSDSTSDTSVDTTSDSSIDSSSEVEEEYFTFTVEFSDCKTRVDADTYGYYNAYLSFGFGNGFIDYEFDDIVFIGNVGGITRSADETLVIIYEAIMFDEYYDNETREALLEDFSISIVSNKIQFVKKTLGAYDLDIYFGALINFAEGFEPVLTTLVVHDGV